MRIAFKTKAPNNIEMTMTATLLLKDWKRLAESLGDKADYWQAPMTEFASAIKAVVWKVEQEFASDMEERT